MNEEMKTVMAALETIEKKMSTQVSTIRRTGRTAGKTCKTDS